MLQNKKRLSHFLPYCFLLLALIVVGYKIFQFQKTKIKNKNYATLNRVVPVMGTILEIKLEGEAPYLNQIAEQIICEIRRIEANFSIFIDSEASKINKNAAQSPIKCSDEMWFILNESAKYYNLSGELFDITIKPLMQLWGFYRKRNELPSTEEITDCLTKVGFNKIYLDPEKKTISFNQNDMSLDFGGIVKGYAVDRAVSLIPLDKVKRGFVNLGGNIKTIQSPLSPPNTYNIGIRHPINKDNICGTVLISGSRALATSGNYEKYVILNGKHYTHIINPLTGKPVENMLSVTVIANDALTADALSTSVFIGGEKLAKELKEKIPELEFLIIQKNPDNQIEIIKIGDSWGDIRI